MVETPHRQHVLIDWWIEDPKWLNHSEPMRTDLIRVSKEFGLNIFHEHFHDFQPVGYTGFLLLSESHLSAHSWVDEGYLALDVFTCRTGNLEPLVDSLRSLLKPYHEEILEKPRGLFRK